VVRDPVAFEAAHPNLAVAGRFSGALNNGGERLALSDAFGTELLALTFDNSFPWPDSPDGRGPSLVLIAPESAPNHDQPQNWRASTTPGGNPSRRDDVPYQGGDLLVYALDHLPHHDLAAGTFSVGLRSGADDVEIAPQWSRDLQSWSPNHLELVGRDPATWRVLPPLDNEPHLFLRVEVRLR